MEKEPFTKFCGVLISSQEVMKLHCFESSVSDIIPVNVQNISFLVFNSHTHNYRNGGKYYYQDEKW